MKPINVCIVDDDDIYQFTMKVTIRNIPTVKSTQVFTDGAQALEYIINNKNDKDALPDIIFLDINMPVMDGFQFMDEFTDLLPKLNKPIQVYLVSSSIDPKDIRKAKRNDAITDYLIKPLKSEQVKNILTQFK
ncbi:response regulator [Allomuricauda sp.]|jgi:CheY-like chemotaxis protein|uniref:response regulator n=1 Tax=Flagellimonas alginolytica TaxID=3177515 RepID=UPI0025FAE968|nr:response regulator [Allomuricauda sp.]